MAHSTSPTTDDSATRNACKLCTPLGASLAFRGIECSIALLHGSQGCATYIRRYLISHFKEPVDIASSSFGEAAVIFGGGRNLSTALDNVIAQYHPRLIGIATTCLAETIGDDVPMFLREYIASRPGPLPHFVFASTPSYQGTHADGFLAAVRSTVATLCEPCAPHEGINLLTGMLSPADLRHLRSLGASFGTPMTLLPDYSDPLDGPAWDDYQLIPSGGTSIEAIAAMGGARASIEMTSVAAGGETAGALLAERFGVKLTQTGLPIGLRGTDRLLNALETYSGRETPIGLLAERGRLIDAMVDAHKYLFGCKALIYGEEDLVVGLASFMAEIGVQAVACCSGGRSGHLAQCLREVMEEGQAPEEVREGADFVQIEEIAQRLKPDMLIGNSKGYALARKLGIPLLRVGFPVHDRLGGARILHVGYAGALGLLDQIANTVIQSRQDGSEVGYSYM